MTIQTVPISKLRSNPRESFEQSAIDGLAASIRPEGLLTHANDNDDDDRRGLTAPATEVTVLHGDCVATMRRMSSASVDFILTDPLT